MKKLLSIIVLGLLLSSNSYAKIIILKKCVHSEDLAFNNETYEKHQYKIDTVKKKLSWISVHKESFVQSADNVTNLPRVVVETYNINYIDDEYILASDNMWKYTVVLKEKSVQMISKKNNFSTTHYCK